MKHLLEKIYGADSEEAKSYQPIVEALLNQLPGAKISANPDGAPQSNWDSTKGLRRNEMVGGMGGGGLLTKEAAEAIRRAAELIEPDRAIEWMNKGTQMYNNPEAYLFRTAPDEEDFRPYQYQDR